MTIVNPNHSYHMPIGNIIIESNSPTIIIRCDDYVDINYTEKIEMKALKRVMLI